jgi:hypothetical protein
VLLLVPNNVNAPRGNGVLDRFVEGVVEWIDLFFLLIGGM